MGSRLFSKSARKPAFDRKAGWIFALIWGAYAVNYLCRKNFSVCIADMVQDQVITELAAGRMMTAFFAVYGAGQLINGFLGDRLNPKWMIAGGLAGSGLINLLLPLSSSSVVLTILWCLNGLFCSMLWGPVIRCMGDYLIESHRLKYAAWLSATIPVGQNLCYLLSAAILKAASWRLVYPICGLTNVAYALIWLCVLRASRGYLTEVSQANHAAPTPSAAEAASASSSAPQKAPIMPLRSLLLSSGIFLGILAMLMNGMLKDGVTDWTPTLLGDTFGLSSSLVSLVMTLLPILSLIGVWLANVLLKWLKNEFASSAVLFGISLLSMTLLIFFVSGNAILTTSLIALSAGAMLGVNNLLLTFIPLHYAPHGRASLATGLLNSFGYAATALSGLLVGILQSASSWKQILLFWTIIALSGLILSVISAHPWEKESRKLYSSRS